MLLYFNCLPDVLLFLTMQWVGLQCVIVAFLDHSKEEDKDQESIQSSTTLWPNYKAVSAVLSKGTKMILGRK